MCSYLLAGIAAQPHAMYIPNHASLPGWKAAQLEVISGTRNGNDFSRIELLVILPIQNGDVP